MTFDVTDFHPSILESLLVDAITFTSKLSTITPHEHEIIFHVRKSLLFNNGESWMTKGAKLFDVTMGAYDGAEICELVGCYVLQQIGGMVPQENIGLYRDYDLAFFRNVNGPQSERIKKDFQKTFKKNGLDIVIQCNMTVVNFLDVTLDLQSSTYKPYHKPGSETNYIHKQSNHPPCIIKQVPLSIEKRLSNLPSNEDIFKCAVPYYEEALSRSVYSHTFTYSPDKVHHKRRSRQRNIIWFNPPYDKSVSTNIGKNFLHLIAYHFPTSHKYHTIFNKNTIKVSYSCLPNIKSIITAHNKRILTSSTSHTSEKTCNCMVKQNCPVNQNCLASNVIYEATILATKAQLPDKKYIGLCETTFKKRYANHKRSFNHEDYKNSTSLSSEYWRLKSMDAEPRISWRIVHRAPSFKPEWNRCPLCLAEKYEIINVKDRDKLLNKRSEVMAQCRHRTKYSLDSQI